YFSCDLQSLLNVFVYLLLTFSCVRQFVFYALLRLSLFCLQLLFCVVPVVLSVAVLFLIAVCWLRQKMAEQNLFPHFLSFLMLLPGLFPEPNELLPVSLECRLCVFLFQQVFPDGCVRVQLLLFQFF